MPLTDGKTARVAGFAERCMVRAGISTFSLNPRDIEISVDEFLVEIGETEKKS